MEPQHKAWYRSRTLAFNFVSLLVLLVGIFTDNYSQLGIVIPDQAVGWLAMVVLLGNGVLRFMTTTAIGVEPTDESHRDA